MQTKPLLSTLILKRSLSTTWSWHRVESCSPPLACCLQGLIALYAIRYLSSSYTCPILSIRQLIPEQPLSSFISFSLSALLPLVLRFLWPEGPECILFPKSRNTYQAPLEHQCLGLRGSIIYSLPA